MPSIETVLFDLDGTLIDSIRLILDSYHHTLATHGLPPRSEAEVLFGIGIPLRVQLAKYAESENEVDALIATYRTFNLANHDRMVRAYPGVVEMV
ncbi:MAG: HAD hydrolase-like protein, partial [Gemmatimonadota bacterium]